MKNLTEYAETLVANKSGATIDLFDGEVVYASSGYFVGGSCEGEHFSGEEHAFGRILRWLRTIPYHVRFVGVWTDVETGIIYLDGSDYFAKKEEALAIAKLREEIAIWDCSANEEIRVA